MLLDAHSHLNRYGEKLEEFLLEIEEEEILTISSSVDIISFQQILDISKRSGFVIPSFGIHPRSAHEFSDKLDKFQEYVKEAPILGVTGLDYSFSDSEGKIANQRKLFEYFLNAAEEENKILVINVYGVDEEVIDYLESTRIKKVVIRHVSHTKKTLQRFLDFGAFFSAGPNIFEDSAFQKTIKEIPPAQLLTETDNPDRLKNVLERNGTPWDIRFLVKKLGSLIGKGESEMTDIVEENIRRLLGNNYPLSEATKEVISDSE